MRLILSRNNRRRKATETKKKQYGRRGSAVVLLCILFISLCGALAVTYEAAERKAAVCVAEAAFDSAGRSMLACFDKELFDRYGVLAFQGDEEKTGQCLEKLAKASIETTKVAGCKVKNVVAEQSAYALSEPDNLIVQLQDITKRAAVVDALGGLKEDLGTAGEKVKDKDQAKEKILELENEREEAKRNAKEAVESARAAVEAGENAEEGPEEVFGNASAELEEIERAENVQNDLKQRAEGLTGELSDYDGNGRNLKNGRIADSLPSLSAGCQGRSAYAGGTVLNDLSGEESGSVMGDDLVTAAYIEGYFRNQWEADSEDKSFFRCETEYILYGEMSDEDNYRNVYRSIFVIRTAVNTAYLYMDAEKRSLILAAAEAMTPGPFAPLTQLLLTTVWAGVEAENDMKNLENGNGVPMMKNSATWMTDLDSAVHGTEGIGYLPIPGDSPMKYSRYLDLLLLTLDRNTKLYRIMDLMQINLKGTVRGDFTVADHYTGFALRSEIGKKSHAVGIINATAEINMTHTYTAGG